MEEKRFNYFTLVWYSVPSGLTALSTVVAEGQKRAGWRFEDRCGRFCPNSSRKHNMSIERITMELDGQPCIRGLRVSFGGLTEF